MRINPPWKNSKKLVRTLRCKNSDIPGVLGDLASTIGSLGVAVGDIRTIEYGRLYVIRDIDILVDDEETLADVLQAASKLKHVCIQEVRDEVLEAHQDGKIEMRTTHPIHTVADLRKVCTPGVANVCLGIFHHSWENCWSLEEKRFFANLISLC
ncbi:MAG: hypothetical protein ACE5JO_09735 [Candidatus Binatia bacterium]